MSPSTRQVRALARRIIGAATMERLVDPILADIEWEHQKARRAGRWWHARWVVVRGYVALCTAVALHGAHVWASAAVPDETTKRTVGFSAGAFLLLTAALVLPPLLSAPGLFRTELQDVATFGLYLVPQTLPLSIPIALAFGIACGWPRAATASVMLRRVALVGVVGLGLTLVAMEWLIPAGNQAFRVEIFSRLAERNPPVRPTLPRGINERSLSELAGLIRESSSPGITDGPSPAAAREAAAAQPGFSPDALQLALHRRIALSLATVLLCLCAVALAHAVRGQTPARSVFAGVTVLYVGAWFGAEAAVPALAPAVAAWLPNAALAAVSLLLLGTGSARGRV